MRLPLATDITSRDGSLSKDSLMKNAFAEKVGEEFDVFKRPGLAQAYDLGAAQGQGLVSWKGTFFSALGNSLVQGPSNTLYPDGSLWTSLNAGHGLNLDLGDVVVAGSTIYIAQCAGGISFLKTTDGITYSAVSSTGLPACSQLLLAAIGTDIYALPTSSSTPQRYVYKSTNGCQTFSQIQLTANWSARYGQGFVAFNNKLYVIGGYAGGALSDVWESTDGITWTQKTAASGMGTRVYANVCADSTRIYLLGGYNFTTNLKDLYSSTDAVTWILVDSDVGFTPPYGAAALMKVTTRLYALDASNGIHVSTDGGATFTTATANAGFHTAGGFLTNLSDSLYFIEFNSTGDTWKSTNNVTSAYNYTLTGAASLPLSFSQTSGAASTEYLFLKTTAKAWVLTFGNPGTLTQITDADYPAITVPGSVYLDGYFFVMTDAAEIYNSDLEDPLNWNALNFISAEIEPDNPVALAKHQNYVVALKDTTTELFYDAANTSGSPLARLSNAAIQVGCANGYSVAALDAGLFFLSKFRSNQKSVHYFPKDGIQPVEIANPSIKRILTAADTSTVHCFACQLNGHSFYVVTLPTEGLTLAYDLTTQTWSQWTFLTVAAADNVSSLTQADGVATATATAHGFADGDPVTIAGATPSGYNGDVNIKYIDANTFSYPVSSALSSTATGTIAATGWTEGYFPFGFYTNALSKDYLQHETSGKIYEISADYGDDAGAPIDWKVRTLPLNQGTVDKKTMARLSVVGDNTVGNLLVRYSDDDYSTFSKYRQIDLSTANKQTRRLGDYRERALDFRYTGDNKIRIRSMDIE